MRFRPRLFTPLAVVLVLALPAGCAGDSGGGDDEQIRALAQFVVTAHTGAEVCPTYLTEDFVSAVFGDLDTCVSSGDEDPADVATGVTVTDLRINGDTATAVVAERGGASDGAAGTWGFARDATGWRVAEWRTDYLRAGFEAELGPDYRSAGADDPFADLAARTCVSAKFQALADPEFRATAFEILRQSEAGEETFRGWYYDCIVTSEGAGMSTLRRIFEDGLRQADIPSEVIECAILKLRESVSDAEIRRMGESGAQAPPPAVQKQIEKATVDCVETTGAS